MSETPADEPRRSPVTVAGLRDALHRAAVTIRRQRLIIGALNREADQQAQTIKGLREDVERWRSMYMRAAADRLTDNS